MQNAITDLKAHMEVSRSGGLGSERAHMRGLQSTHVCMEATHSSWLGYSTLMHM
jgi:hypothetical protein